MVTYLPKIHIEHGDICKGCALGKITNRYFPSSDNRSKGILNLVHMYYVAFINDFSQNTWIYFMRNKDGVFNKFQEF